MEEIIEYIKDEYSEWQFTCNKSDLYNIVEASAIEGQLFELERLVRWALKKCPDNNELAEIKDQLESEYESMLYWLERKDAERQRDFCDIAAKQSREEAQ